MLCEESATYNKDCRECWTIEWDSASIGHNIPLSDSVSVRWEKTANASSLHAAVDRPDLPQERGGRRHDVTYARLELVGA